MIFPAFQSSLSSIVITRSPSDHPEVADNSGETCGFAQCIDGNGRSQDTGIIQRTVKGWKMLAGEPRVDQNECIGCDLWIVLSRMNVRPVIVEKASAVLPAFSAAVWEKAEEELREKGMDDCFFTDRSASFFPPAVRKESRHARFR